VSDETIDDLLQVAAEFGNCGDCVYVQSGYPLLCTTCAARTLEPLAPKDARCPVCDHPHSTGHGTCLNGPCNMGDLNRGFVWNWSISMRTGSSRTESMTTRVPVVDGQRRHGAWTVHEAQ